jgi:zinc protease
MRFRRENYKLLRYITIFAVALFATTSAFAQAGGSLKLPQYQKTRLPNGLTLLLMEKHNLPLVSFEAVIKTGSSADPAGEEGTASATVALLRRGTQSRSADQFSEQIDFIGGIFGTNVNSDYTTVSAEFMKKDLEKGLDLLADPLLHPTFPQEEIAKMMKQRIDGIRAAKDQAAGVIGLYFNAYLYGANAYGRPTGGDEQSLARIDRDAIAKFYATYFKPGNTILAVVGDFDSAQMQNELAARFGSWAAGEAPRPAVQSAASIQGKHLLLVDKPDSTQTYFRIGNIGIARTSPDHVNLMVVNTLFGGRFTSLINTALRIQSGLTYGANSAFDERRNAGSFYISSYTRNATTERALDMSLDVLKQFRDKGVSAEQLTSAKNYIKGQYPQRIETSDQLATLISQLEFYGFDRGEVDNFYSKIDAMTLADAKRAIDQYYPADNLVFVIVGKASEIGPIVKKYAPQVDTRSISDPGFSAAPGSH